MSCIKISKTNKGESNLFKTIYDNLAGSDEGSATLLYNYFETEAFRKVSGYDYVALYTSGETNDKVDENGEPKLFYNETAKRYYFLGANDQKVYYPLINRGLSRQWSQEQIKNTTSRLVASYIKANLKLDFNNIDFSDLKDLPSIKSFIVSEIKNKIADLEEAEDYGRVDFLEEALSNISELHDLVIQKFKSISIDVNEKEDKENENNDEQTRENQFGSASYSRSSKSGVSNNIKLRLSLLTDSETKDNVWNDNALMDFDTVYSKLQEILCNNIPAEGEYLFDTYLDKISEASVYFPYLKEVYQMVSNNKDEQFRTEFAQAFYLAKNSFVNERYSKSTEGLNQSSVDLTNSYDKISGIKEEWIEGFKTKFMENSKIKREKFEEYKSLYGTKLSSLIKRSAALDSDSKSNEDTIKRYSKLVQNALIDLGFNVSNEAMDYFLGSSVGVDRFNKINKLAISFNGFALKNISDNIISDYNPADIFRSADLLNQLIKAESFVTNDMSDPNLRIAGNKRWLFSNPSYLHIRLERWKKNPETLLAEYENDAYTEGSNWIKKWFDISNEDLTYEERIEVGRKNLSKVKLGILGEITFVMDNNKAKFKETTDLSYKDYLLNNLNSTLKESGFTRTITQADKGSELTIKSSLARIKGFLGINSENESFILSEDSKSVYLNYYISELKRMLVAKNEVLDASKPGRGDKLTSHYHYDYKKSLSNPSSVYSLNGNAFKSQYFEKLNPGKAKTITEKAIVDLIYKDGNLSITELSNQLMEKLTPLFESYLQEMVTKESKEVTKELSSLGIIKRVNGLFVNKLIDVNLFASYVQGDGVESINSAVEQIAIDYVLNGISNNIEYSKLFTGDVAYYKNAVDFKKRVPATYTDGKYLILKPDEEEFKIAVINAVEIDSPFLTELKKQGIDEETISMLSDINSTDAQAWITPKRWKFLKQKLGQWSPVHDEVFKKMQSGKNEEYSKEELKITAQPLKGVYFNKINGKPVFLKYSQAVLSTAMVKGTQLEAVLAKMELNEVDELITFDGIKVGAIEPTTIHDSNGNILDDFELNVQVLNNHYWKLQQDLPTKTFKDTDVGSQIQKNIMAGIKHFLDNKNFKYKEGEISGQELNDILVNTIGKLSDIGYENLIRKAGINTDGKITNIPKFYRVLIDELKSRGGSENVLKALEAETSLLGIPQSTGKLFQIFASMINKGVIKIQTNGGSFIQMADFGLTPANLEGKTGITLNPNIKGLNPPMISTDENGKKKVTPGSVFVPASFIAYHIPNWKDYSAEELFVSYNDGAPVIDKKIQETIIGYRIPNQGLPSNDSLQIAGILPESSGDTIVAYVGITSKTGSDYDIDKMYIMFPKYSKVEDRLEYSTEGEEGVQNDLIEVYKSVLTNPEVYNEVMKSIDNDFIKDEINSLKSDESDSFMSSMNPRDDIKLRYSFLGGKAGVGMEANAMTDIWRTGTLKVNSLLGFKWGNYNKASQSIELDMQYSETLPEEDMAYYSESLGKNEKHKSNIRRTLSKIKISDTLGTILNAFVDIAKDPYITKGNWVTSTTNVGNFMVRMGVHPLYVINFLSNPIISRYIQYQQDNEGLFDNDSGDMFNKFKVFIISEYLNDPKKGGNSLFGSIYSDEYSNIVRDADIEKLVALKDKEGVIKYTKQKKDTDARILKKITKEEYDKFLTIADDYHNQIFNPKKLNIFNRTDIQHGEFKTDLKYFREQVAAKEPNLNFAVTLLNEFRTLQQASKGLKTIVDFGKLDVNGIGKDPNGIFQLEGLLNEIENNTIEDVNDSEEENTISSFIITGFDSKLDNTILSKYYNNLLKVKNILQNNPDMFPLSLESVRNISDGIVNRLGKMYSAKDKLYDTLSKEFKTYIYNDVLDISDEERKEIYANLHKEAKAFRDSNKDKYFILDKLTITGNSIKLKNSEKSEEFERMFTNSWSDLFEDNPKLAEDLVKYSFLSSGFQMNKDQFYSFIPHQYFIDININKRINNFFLNDNFEDFENKFYLNNLKDNQIVRSVVMDEDILLRSIGPNSAILSKKDLGAYIRSGEKFFKHVGLMKNSEQSLYIEIKNKPEDITYNTEVEVHDFNTDLLRKRTVDVVKEKEAVIEEREEVIETKEEEIASTKTELLKSLFKKNTDIAVKGSVVEYKGLKWIVWNITDSNRAQLINTNGEKFSGTPNLDKLTKIGDYTTTDFNGTDYIVTANENIYSLDTGKQVFTSLDGSTKTKKEMIINQIMEENGLDTIELIYNKFKDQLSGTSLAELKQIEAKMGTEKTIEYIKKCKG